MSKAFTLIELIIVMGIISAVTGVAVTGIIRYKATVELSSVYTELVASIKTQRNKATNSVSYNSNVQGNLTFKAPAFYALRFINNDYDFYFCNFAGQTRLITCSKEVNLNHSTLPTGTIVTSTCDGIGFELISGDVVKVAAQSFITSSAYESKPAIPNCVVTIDNPTTGINKTLDINFVYDKLTL